MNLRLQRVCELLKRELGSILVRDMQFDSPLVTVSGVDITPDLKQAHVFVSALGTANERRDALTSLEKNRVSLQQELMKRVVLKHTPHLNFRLDDSIERGTRILEIMDDLGLPDTTAASLEEDDDDDFESEEER